jgi:hypothetical protein
MPTNSTFAFIDVLYAIMMPIISAQLEVHVTHSPVGRKERVATPRTRRNFYTLAHYDLGDAAVELVRGD